MIRYPDPTPLIEFAPELAAVAGLVSVLLAGIVAPAARLAPLTLSLAGFLIAAGLAIVATPAEQPIWNGWLVSDAPSLYFRVLLYLGGAATVGLLWANGYHRPPRSGAFSAHEFTVLLLGATLGLALMTAASHLLMIYLAVEMASLPSYLMVGFRRYRHAGEAALKYAVFGSAASGVMLYGLSVIYGLSGSLRLADLAATVAAPPEGAGPALTVAVVCVLAGLMFKAAAVPFHFWCPDVLEGANAEVAGFLSTAGKAAAMALLLRFTLTVVEHTGPGHPASELLATGLGVSAVLGMTLGNLAAFAQTNLQRLLAYSVIAHAGYMLMAVAALSRPTSAEHADRLSGTEAVMIYAGVYLFMNLGAFGAVSFVRHTTGNAEIATFAGVGRRLPVTGVCLTVAFMSLAGIPPLAGFLAKFSLFAALYSAAHPRPDQWDVLLLLVLSAGLLNTAMSLFYYARVVGLVWAGSPKSDDAESAALADADSSESTPSAAEDSDWSESLPARLFSAAMIAPLVALAVFWGPVAELTARAAAGLVLGSGSGR